MTSQELKLQIQDLQSKLSAQLEAEKNAAIAAAKEKFPCVTMVTSLESNGIDEWENTLQVFHPETMSIPGFISFREDHGLWDMEEKGLICIID